MKLGVKYLYLTSSSGKNFCIYQLREGLGMRNMLAHGIRMLPPPLCSFLIRTHTCSYQGVRNTSFPEKFANVLNE